MTAGGVAQIMSMGSEALSNARSGVEVAGHNIANVNTPGYSRQHVVLATRDPMRFGNVIYGNGAFLQGIDRSHDKYLESQYRKQIETTTEKESVSRGLERVQSIFNPELTSTVRDRMNSFFNSLRDLSNYPEEPSVRTNVSESATNLTLAFQSAHSGIVNIQNDINDELISEVGIFNQKLEEIGTLNQQILEMRSGSSQPNDLMDKRDALVQDICGLMDIQISENNRGLCVRGPKGVLLVEGSYHGRLELNRGSNYERPSLLLHDFTNTHEMDITESVSSGKLGGLIKVRDNFAHKVRTDLNEMAKGFGKAFNEVHREGYGSKNYETLKGRDFFEWDDDTSSEPASSLRVRSEIVEDPFAIAAAFAQGSPGDNVVANELVKLQYSNIMNNGKSTIFSSYDNTVGQLGVDSMRAKEDISASNIVMNQLKSQRESVSGVSLDEEAANLLKYQQFFQASSRIITTADELMKTVLDLKR